LPVLLGVRQEIPEDLEDTRTICGHNESPQVGGDDYLQSAVQLAGDSRRLSNKVRGTLHARNQGKRRVLEVHGGDGAFRHMAKSIGLPIHALDHLEPSIVVDRRPAPMERDGEPPDGGYGVKELVREHVEEFSFRSVQMLELLDPTTLHFICSR